METSKIENIDAEEFESRLAKDPNAILLDVRTEDEFNSQRIPGAICANIMSVDFLRNISTLDRTKNLYVYCRSGARSTSACQVLAKEGFKIMYNLSGGIMDYGGKLESN